MHAYTMEAVFCHLVEWALYSYHPVEQGSPGHGRVYRRDPGVAHGEPFKLGLHLSGLDRLHMRIENSLSVHPRK